MINEIKSKQAYDFVGDIHGCFSELLRLLGALGYIIERFDELGEEPIRSVHPDGRKVVFIGDYVDRGPNNMNCLRLAIGMCEQGSATGLLGNHDLRLLQHLNGESVPIKFGRELTVAELQRKSEAFACLVRDFLSGLKPFVVLEDYDLIASHAGMPAGYLERNDEETKRFALFGKELPNRDSNGLPIRYDWALDYHGQTKVIYGHTPVLASHWTNNTICIDTGCPYGGSLTALRWPENVIVSVPSPERYYKNEKILKVRP